MRGRLLCLLFTLALCAPGAEDEISKARRGLYRAPEVGPVSMANSPRIDSLYRAGNLYLSLRDAIALAIENNLDVQFQRLNAPISQTDTLRAKGGGTLRGISTAIDDVPPGLGGPGAPLVTSAATGTIGGSTLAAYTSDLSFITELPLNNSVLPPAAYSAGPPIPAFDPAVTGQEQYLHSTTPEPSPLVSGLPTLVQGVVTSNIGYSQSFSPGTQVNVGFNNMFTDAITERNLYNPYTASSLGINVTQPLLRGFGIALNRRFIRIAKNDEKISDLVFKEQLISTVSGVIRLYQDLVALDEDIVNRKETLALAERLNQDNHNKVEAGTLAPVEETRAQAQVASARQDLINAEGFAAQQELIVKSVITRRFTSDPMVRSAHIVPTDNLDVQNDAAEPTIEDLLSSAGKNRPDLLFAGIQVDNSKIYLEGSRNEMRPELDLVGTAQNNGLAGALDPMYSPGTSTGVVVPPIFQGGYGDVLSQIARRGYPTYGIGINLTLPLRNRVAEADAVRDEYQLRQTEVNRQRLTNSVQLEVESALVSLNRAHDALGAAVEARKLQQQSLEIEQERYEVGLSTTFLVLQYQSFLAQARSTEIAAKATYAKSRTALDRAVGLTLDSNSVAVGDAYHGIGRR